MTFEFDLTLYRIDRDVYSVLDWIGDVGGLNEGLYIILKMVLLFCQFNDLKHFMIPRLFKQSQPTEGTLDIDNKYPMQEEKQTKDSELNNRKTYWLR